MLLWSTHEHESLGGGRREGSLVVPFVSRVGTGVVPVAGSLMTDSERTKVVNKYLVGNILRLARTNSLLIASLVSSSHHQMTFQSRGSRRAAMPACQRLHG